MIKRLRKLQSGLEEWERKAEDLPHLADTVWSVSDTFAEVKKTVTPKLANVKDFGLRCRLVLEVKFKIFIIFFC